MSLITSKLHQARLSLRADAKKYKALDNRLRSLAPEIKEVYEKTGRSGRMVFVVRRTRYTNQHGEDVASVETTAALRETKPLDGEAAS